MFFEEIGFYVYVIQIYIEYTSTDPFFFPFS